jgi:hypothetical protein
MFLTSAAEDPRILPRKVKMVYFVLPELEYLWSTFETVIGHLPLSSRKVPFDHERSKSVCAEKNSTLLCIELLHWNIPRAGKIKLSDMRFEQLLLLL